MRYLFWPLLLAGLGLIFSRGNLAGGLFCLSMALWIFLAGGKQVLQEQGKWPEEGGNDDQHPSI